jgi:hypothetical protein
MKYLLDVNVLVAAIWDGHEHHADVWAWLPGKHVTLCPLAELGFLRISTLPKFFNFSMEDARRGLGKFRADRKAALIPDGLDVLKSHPRTSSQVTDYYLADLAAKHGLKLATFDERINHPSIELIASK